jgi:hypothetical protein
MRKRKSVVKVPINNGKITATLEFELEALTLREEQRVVDEVTEGVVTAVRNPPYNNGTVPLRSVKIS